MGFIIWDVRDAEYRLDLRPRVWEALRVRREGEPEERSDSPANNRWSRGRGHDPGGLWKA